MQSLLKHTFKASSISNASRMLFSSVPSDAFSLSCGFAPMMRSEEERMDEALLKSQRVLELYMVFPVPYHMCFTHILVPSTPKYIPGPAWRVGRQRR